MNKCAASEVSHSHQDERRGRVVALITCHNRSAKTLACLDALFNNDLPVDVSLHVILVDDGSTDGTEGAVREEYPMVEVIKGDGNLYWNRGMHLAFERAIQIGFDSFLWLNDDTVLYPDAIARLMETDEQLRCMHGKDSIVVGSTQGEFLGGTTYGGLRRVSRLYPLKFNLVEPANEAIPCDTMNGNCVFMSHEIVAVVGNLKPHFAHAMGDVDYGLRAHKSGFKVWVAPGFFGKCERNSQIGTFYDRTLPLIERFRKMVHPKGLPITSWWVFAREHGGVLWPVYFVWPYIRVLLTSVLRRY